MYIRLMMKILLTAEFLKLGLSLLKKNMVENMIAPSLDNLKKMSVTKTISMIPGLGSQVKDALKDKDIDLNGKEMRRIEAIILSMTPKERANTKLINGSRRKRIAMGSGTRVQDVNKLLKQFEEMQKMMKRMKKMQGGKKGGFGGLKLPFMH